MLATRVIGWATRVFAALAHARADSSKPWLIACKTTIGYGAPTKAGKASTHGEPLGEEEIKGTREKLVWPHAPFEIPEPVLLAWRAVGQRGAKERANWKQRAAQAGPHVDAALSNPAAAGKMADVVKAVSAAKAAFATDEAKRATRVWSQLALEKIVPVLPELIGGSADLTGSNGTRTKDHLPVGRGSFAGNYIHHLRWPWGLSKSDWREDEHVRVGAPSVTMIPARVIHTSEAQQPGPDGNRMADIFAPPRLDFSLQKQWVKNSEEYPLPPGQRPWEVLRTSL